MSRRREQPPERHVEVQPGDPALDSEASAPPPAASSSASATHPRIHVTGDLQIAPDARMQESLQVDGAVRVGRGARLEGDLTAQRDVEVGERVTVAGGLESAGSIVWSPDAEASRVASRGPFVLADGHACATSLVARRGVHPRHGGGA